MKIENKDLESIFKYIKINKKELAKKILDRKFPKQEAFDEFLKESIIQFLKDEVDDLKSKISGFRKQGDDMSHLSIKLMKVPLKIKVFQVSFKKEDFDKVVKILDGVKKGLEGYKLRE